MDKFIPVTLSAAKPRKYSRGKQARRLLTWTGCERYNGSGQRYVSSWESASSCWEWHYDATDQLHHYTGSSETVPDSPSTQHSAYTITTTTTTTTIIIIIIIFAVLVDWYQHIVLTLCFKLVSFFTYIGSNETSNGSSFFRHHNSHTLNATSLTLYFLLLFATFLT